MSIPLTDLTSQYLSLKADIDAAIQGALLSGSFILGPEVQSFEQEMAAYCQTGHGIGVASGTDALHLALLACGIGQGDEVITTPFTFIATAESIAKCGATPVFVDIEPGTYNINPALIEQHITPRTRALLPVHLYGQACDMTRIMAIARGNGLKVIEDCAQALGATWNGQRVGSFGDAGCLSFFPSKMLGAFGDGGLVVTYSDEVAQQVRILRNHGARRKYYHEVNGFNSRLDSLQAAVLRVKLPHLDRWLAQRNDIAVSYAAALGTLPGLAVPVPTPGSTHAFNYYTIRLQGTAGYRDRLADYLRSSGIASAIYYPVSLHLQDVYRGLHYAPGTYPVSEKAQDEVLSLPIYPEMTPSQVEQVTDAIATFGG
ncbi:MAG: DegT/DnrJ/EryC1/StrS family aminotransferase [Dehalococcoidia bacterium]|nr:DegT/DnrJ/EryC1/StrS family aminotransferase [Dehalococcoidia bacterium]